jgi:5-oxoprolinase (ATP-hydrolysing)
MPLHVEMMDIVTVAAGGGSILGFDGRKMTVGPESAGAYPGPACYGFGGPLTVTDANLMTGRVVPERFPRTFGPERDSPPFVDIVRDKFRQLAEQINRQLGTDMSPHETAAGFLRIANERMAMAIREISVSRGVDIRNYALVCFGGAGAQHACPIAELLDIRTIIVHPLSGVMSAYGIALSRAARKGARTVLMPFDRDGYEKITDLFIRLEEELMADALNTDLTGIEPDREIDLRPAGTDSCITVPFGGFEEVLSGFLDRYEKMFGFVPDASAIEAVNIRSEIPIDKLELPEFREPDEAAETAGEGVSTTEIFYPGGLRKALVYSRPAMPAGKQVRGPAVIADRHFTIVVDPGFSAVKDERGIITITRESDTGPLPDSADGKKADPVLLEVFGNTFMGIASEMGHTLRNTAHSVNMKERLDFSCAIFDAEGGLVANAPHIPVHLGAMADAVKALIEEKGDAIGRGHAYLTNNPYRGGSHLPDVTVICPVFSEDGEILFFTAARGHHADIGGTAPGSMPAEASHIDEEGVVLDNFLYLSDGRLREDELRSLLTSAPYPARNISERLADCRAQLAACRKGISEIERLIERYGIDTVSRYMRHIQDHAEYSVKRALMKFSAERGVFDGEFEDRLDDGTVIRVSIHISAGDDPPATVRAVIDFSGSGPWHRNDNLNAPYSVTRSAVLYVLRSLVEEDLPLNSGCLRPVKIIIPEGSVLNPPYPAPVASGNVETSQRIVDVLLGAFGVAAASQGTMNNILFEVEGESPYYETIAGGAGAMPGCPGAAGVQVHMTNTRITDPEILEHRHPGVRIEMFTFRRGSGGSGLFPGGDGVVREIRFLRPARISIISERRVHPPYGLDGGGEGMRGRNLLRLADGTVRALPGRAVFSVSCGDSVIIETPGGGGYGRDRDKG